MINDTNDSILFHLKYQLSKFKCMLLGSLCLHFVLKKAMLNVHEGRKKAA